MCSFSSTIARSTAKCVEEKNVELITIRVPRMLLRRPSFECFRRRPVVDIPHITLSSEKFRKWWAHQWFMGRTTSPFDVTRFAIDKAKRNHALRELVAGARSMIIEVCRVPAMQS